MLAGCNNHPTVKATLNCSQCHKPACDKCIVNGRFCSTACNEKFSKFTSSYKKPQGSSNIGNIISTVVFLGVVGAAIYVTKVVLKLW